MIRETEAAIRGLLHTDAESLVAQFVANVEEYGTEEVRRHALNLVIREDGMRATSRSTSVIGNLVADVRRSVSFGVATALEDFETRHGNDPEKAAAYVAEHMHHRLNDIVR